MALGDNINVWELIEATIPHVHRMLLKGPPGTGKTYAACYSGLQPGQQVVNITLTPDTPAAELRGHFIPRGNEFVWHDGPCIKAWRLGARLVLNEIDRASDDALTFLYGILDDLTIANLDLPSGESIKPNKMFTVVGTTNADESALPDALRDRFATTILVNEVHPKAIESLPEDLRPLVTGAAMASDPERRMPLRKVKAYAYLRTQIDPTMAAKAVFNDRAEEILMALATAAA